MVCPFNSEIGDTLPNHKRLTVSIADAGVEGQGLKLRLGMENVLKVSAQGAGVATTSPAQGSRCIPGAHNPPPSPIHLTAREIQILRLVVSGMHNQQIAARIHRSIKTVEKHRQSLHTKLKTHEVASLTRYALSIGLLGTPPQVSGGARHLTPREIEVLKLVAQGSGNKWIASVLQRSIKTVDHHRENIMKKLGIHEVAGLTRYAAFLGLL